MCYYVLVYDVVFVRHSEIEETTSPYGEGLCFLGGRQMHDVLG